MTILPRRLIPGQDGALALGLAALVIATRVPFRSQMLFNWDAANFALALRSFDVGEHAPHPPGYIYFVGVAKLFSLAGLGANDSLVLTATLLSAGAVAALYYLGRLAFDRPTGLVAALLLASSVTFWSYGELALAYPALALFSSLTAIFAWRCVVEGEARALPATVALGVGAGFRPDLLLLMGPLWLACLRPLRTALVCLVLAAGLVSLWLVPTALLSGGFTTYWDVLSAYFGTDVVAKYSSTERGFSALIVNLRDTASYLFYALYATSLPLAGAMAWGLAHWIRRDGSPWRVVYSDRRVVFFALWLAPILAFYTVVHIGDPGYVFSFLPAVLLLTAWFLVSLTRRLATRWQVMVAALVIALMAANGAVFLFHPRLLTLPGIRANDACLRARLEHVQQTYPPQTVALLSYSSYKHLRFYLPEYEESHWVDIHRPEEDSRELASGVQWLLLFDPELVPLVTAEPRWEMVALVPGVAVLRAPVRSGGTVVFGGSGIHLP